MQSSELKKTKTPGFTLIELLIVMAILGIIASVLLVLFNEARGKARDSQRLSDISTIQSALAIYAAEQNLYPQALISVAINNINDPLSTALKPNILAIVPIDPLDGQDPLNNGTIFHYYYFSNGLTYTITYCQEIGSTVGQSRGCANTRSY